MKVLKSKIALLLVIAMVLSNGGTLVLAESIDDVVSETQNTDDPEEKDDSENESEQTSVAESETNKENETDNDLESTAIKNQINNLLRRKNMFYDYVVKEIDGTDLNLSDLKGKVVMVVNTATS